MSAHTFDVTLADFDAKVLATSEQVPVVVDFWAPWCQPCRILKPLLEKLADEYGGRFILAKVNSDENQPLAQRYGVRGIPAVMLFRGGAKVDEFTGALPEVKIREFIERLIPSPAEPLRLEALALAAAGDLPSARVKMAEAIRLDPKNEAATLDLVELNLEANDCVEAQKVLESVADRARDQSRIAALRARLQLVQGGGSADIAGLETRLRADANDHEARLRLANACALQQDYRRALEHLLELVRRGRTWNDEAGRKGMLNLFTILAAPQYDDLVREFRIALSRTLN